MNPTEYLIVTCVLGKDNVKDADLFKLLKKARKDKKNHSKLATSFEKLSLIDNKARVSYPLSITVNGYKFDIAKSGLQKYIRRGNQEKALYVAAELDLFRWITKGKTCVTNFANRLRVILLEDIGLACPQILIDADERLKKWEMSKNLSTDLLALVSEMCTCPHSRFYSHLRSYFDGKSLTPKEPKMKFKLGADENLRKEVNSGRPRINNRDSVLDREQKQKGKWAIF